MATAEPAPEQPTAGELLGFVMCPSGRRAFDTADAARWARTRSRPATESPSLRTQGHAETGEYLCPSCGSWHLTGAPGGTSRGRNRRRGDRGRRRR